MSFTYLILGPPLLVPLDFLAALLKGLAAFFAGFAGAFLTAFFAGAFLAAFFAGMFAP
ncbi:MAG: hypothetical protein SF097_11405 [Acidobacteriota bacterium]|nr:hypothetical protein [Acidobacteriota bacterium]